MELATKYGIKNDDIYSSSSNRKSNDKEKVELLISNYFAKHPHL